MKRVFLLFLLPFFVACDSGTEWRDGNYQVSWIDASPLSLNFDVGNGGSVERVKGEVIAVGSNKDYVIAKQRDPKTKEISFFYIERIKDGIYKNAEEITQGPYTETEFSGLRQKLGLPNFTKEFRY